MPNTIEIPAYFNENDIDNFFVDSGAEYDTMHATMFKRRKGVALDEAIKLAAEMPEGAFIAGGFMRALIIVQPVTNYDIFFKDAATLLNMVRRIQNAPEGSFLHGYSSIGSVREFASQEESFIKFTHPSKPALKLFRVRWFESMEDYLDVADLSVCRFAMDSNLTVKFTQQSYEDAKYKRLRLLRNSFPVGSGLRIKRFELMGYAWYSDYYDTYYRADYAKFAQQYMDSEAKLAKANNLPAPANNGEFGLFVP